MASWLRNPKSEQAYQQLLHGLFAPSGCTLDRASRSRQAEDQKATLVMPDECKNALKRSVDGMAVRFPVGPPQYHS